jgi:hypothetical protein
MLGHQTTLLLTTWDRETLRAVALAYRGHRRIGAFQSWAVHAATRAYLERHLAGWSHATAALWKGVGAAR